jgi:hypothetical protein
MWLRGTILQVEVVFVGLLRLGLRVLLATLLADLAEVRAEVPAPAAVNTLTEVRAVRQAQAVASARLSTTSSWRRSRAAPLGSRSPAQASEYSRQVTASVTTACSYSDFSCSYGLQLPRASLPPPTRPGRALQGAGVVPGPHSTPGGAPITACPMHGGPKTCLCKASLTQNPTEDHPGFAVGPLPSFWWDARCTGCHRTSCNRFWCPTTAMPRKPLVPEARHHNSRCYFF